MTKETQILVTGYQDVRMLAAGETQSSKLRKALDLKAKGHELELITEADLIQVLGDVDSPTAGGRRVAVS